MATIPYFDKDLSWLSFNYRVLLEATPEEVPLLEKINFLSIYCSNLDEFYRVRMPALLALQKIKRKKGAGKKTESIAAGDSLPGDDIDPKDDSGIFCYSRSRQSSMASWPILVKYLPAGYYPPSSAFPCTMSG